MNHDNSGTPPLDPKHLMRKLAAYRDPNTARSLWELGITVIAFLATLAAILFAVDAGYIVALVLAPVSGLLLLRLFLRVEGA